MNPVLILTYNNLAMTQQCVESIRAQDVETKIFVIDNGSTDGTYEWLQNKGIFWTHFDYNAGVSFGWNDGLGRIFSTDMLYREDHFNFDHALVLNNDTVLPPWFYSELLSYDVPFVTGVAVDQMPTIRPEKMPLNPHPDFSAFLIRKEAWEKIGPFDERMKLYSSDQDYHLRGHYAGVKMMKANVPYYHINSQTLKRASAEDRAAIETQANLDRDFLKQKWGVSAGGADYQALFTPESFGSGRKGNL